MLLFIDKDGVTSLNEKWKVCEMWAHLGLGQGEAGAAQDVLLAHAVLLCAQRPHHYLHLLQSCIAALAAEQATHLLPNTHPRQLSAMSHQ